MPPKAAKSTTAVASSRVPNATPSRQPRQASKSPSKPSPTKTTNATSTPKKTTNATSTPKKSTSVVAKKKPPTRTTRGNKQLEVDKDDESSEDESEEEEEVVVAPVKNKKENIKTKVDGEPTSLTPTPRKYINVTDQFTDQKGQVLSE